MTNSQIKGVIRLFTRSFVNENNKDKQKNMFIEFENDFGRGITAWENLCRESIRSYTSDTDSLKYFDELVSKKGGQKENQNINIRLMKETDYNQVKELIKRTFLIMSSKKKDDERLSKYLNSGYSIVACDGEEVLGVALAYELPDLSIGVVYLDVFIVSESARNQGIGRRMISYLGSLMPKEEPYILRLQTDKKMAAYEIYRHWGFRETAMVELEKDFLFDDDNGN